MDSIQEGEQAKQNKKQQQTPPLQTLALDDSDLPPSVSADPPPQVCLLHPRSSSDTVHTVCGAAWQHSLLQWSHTTTAVLMSFAPFTKLMNAPKKV